MTRHELESLLQDIRRTRIAVVGDYCLDVYWFINMSRSEPSVETGLDTLPVQWQRCSLGGAGNVVSNLVDLGCGQVAAFGVVGADPWGHEMLRLLQEKGVDVRGLLTESESWATLTYIKPHIADTEQQRIDFGNFNSLPTERSTELLTKLEARLGEFDLVVVNQQVLQGIHTEEFREGLRNLIRRHPETVFIVDSRHWSSEYPDATLKVNDREAVRLCGRDTPPGALVIREDVLAAASELHKKTGKIVFVTRGERGCVVCHSGGIEEIPGIQVLSRTDPVGAGDSFLAGAAAALAAGCPPGGAALLGNFAASVTVRKLRQTGTASPAEILEVGSDPDYVYFPELAEDIRRARYLPGTEFEVVTQIPEGFRPTHAIFDHDGTISTLRQGWEEIMEPMMVRAVLGPRFEGADESLYHRVLDRVREFIDKTTGVQTITQMQMLIDIVREFGCVPEEEILDAAGYKAIYNEDLMKMVRGRVAKLQRGELSVEDVTVKNAPAFLERLHAAGVKLYLASGTDQRDVEEEAAALGYAHLFEGRIYGSVGDPGAEAKRLVLERIMRDIEGAPRAGLVTFGDGPVEIRETRKRGGLAVGVASDEVRRYGANLSKRPRLIRAGAVMVIPDFSQMNCLLQLLGAA
ncbi:MAG: PfkB family carbohydrate kinase [Armatimonadota bacterium]